MNNQARKPPPHHRWTAEQEAALRNLAEAVRQAQDADTQMSQELLRSAVDAARDAGVGWTKEAQAEWDRRQRADRDEQ